MFDIFKYEKPYLPLDLLTGTTRGSEPDNPMTSNEFSINKKKYYLQNPNPNPNPNLNNL